MNTELVTALIDAGAQIVSAGIPSVAALLAARSFLKLKQARSTAYTAIKEVKYFREIEKEATKRLAEYTGKTPNSARIEIRKTLANKGIVTESRLTPAELDRRLEVYAKYRDK